MRLPVLPLVVLLPVVLAAGCTGSSDDRAASGRSPAATPTGTPRASTGTAAAACEEPSQRLLDWAGVSVASHPGPITAAATVFAATTPTGDWYVLAVERAYVRDDGSRAGGHSRSLALTNTAGPGTSDPHLIDIGLAQKDGGVAQDWRNVRWTGATLAAGRRAAAAAVACLDRA